MKYIHTWTGFVCLLFTISGAFAQTTRYIDPVNGKGSGTCISSDPANTNGPCTLAHAFTPANLTQDATFLIRVHRSGSTVELAAPTAALTRKITFGTYVQGGDAAVEGTIRFTGTFTISVAGGGIYGEFAVDPKARVRFTDLTITEFGRSVPFFVSGSEERIAITGTLTNNLQNYNAPLGKLDVSESFTLKGSSLFVNTLTVHREAVLTLSTSMYLVARRGSSDTDNKSGIVTVHGEIAGTYSFLIAYLNFSSVQLRGGASDRFFHTYDEYTPAADGSIDYSDCIRITGTGKMTVSLYVLAGGNLCYELTQVARIRAFGSVTEFGTRNAAQGQDRITTDIIFRNDVVIGSDSPIRSHGNVEVWNDARIVFEKTAMIKGDVIVEDGTDAYSKSWDNIFGAPRATSVRKGVQIGGTGDYTCAYTTGASAAHIPGVQFAGAATMEGEVHVRASALADGTPNSDRAGAPACAPRVLFLAPVAQATTPAAGLELMSSIAGDVVVEDAADFNDKGRIHLDADVHGSGASLRRTAHNVRVGRDISAKGNTIGMAYPSTSNIGGMCTGRDVSLLFGNHLVLTDARESVVIGDATSGVTLDALVTFGDLRVEPGKGPLRVKTLHVGSDAELTANRDVKVTESMILQGELSGELDESSTMRTLTYGNGNTDVVKTTGMLDALAIHVGRGELRLDEVHKTKNLGLCSGTLSLVDAESTTDSTLHVTEQITVQNGMLEKDTNDPGSLSTDILEDPTESDRYVLTYITPGGRTVTDALEWFAPRDVIVNHAQAEIMVSGDRSVEGKLTVMKGKLIVEGNLTVGTSTLDRTGATALTNTGKYSVVVTAGELHTKDVVVHGKVTVSGTSRFVTSGGDLHVLGRVAGGVYADSTAQMMVAEEAMIDLGEEGTLILGPNTTAGKDLKDKMRPDVLLTLKGNLTGSIDVPKGSKETTIDASSGNKMLGTITFDGTKTPGTDNHDGLLRILSATEDEKKLTIDSLSAVQGSVETHNKKVVITDSVHVRSATIFSYSEITEFMNDLTVSGTGGLNTEYNADGDKRSVIIHGDFTQRKGTSGGIAGVRLHPMTTKTVMGDFMVASDASSHEGETASGNLPTLVLHRDFHFLKKGKLNAKVEFKGGESQTVMTGVGTELYSVVVHNPKGLMLKSHIRQQKMATLTLRQGKLQSMPADSMYTWTVQNVQVEQELRGRLLAQEGSKCGADQDEACKASILRGSRQSYAATPVVRHLLQGNAGTGAASGGYLFPVGREEGDRSFYRPLILQLPSDLIDTTAATVSPIMVPQGVVPAWPAGNLVVPTTGGNLTLDTHADLFWKVELNDELPRDTNLRVVAEGIRNVTDASGLRIVQWDCHWKNPKLAGRHRLQTDASSFAVNGYINGVLNLTQEGIGLGNCAILGIAANGIENPIDQADLSGGRAMIQFIHNLPGSEVVDLLLGEVRIGSGLSFRRATAYRPVGAGSLELTIQPVDPSGGEQAVTYILSLAYGKNYAVIVHGSLTDPRLKVLEMRTESSVSNKVEVRMVHGSPDLGSASVQVMDLMDPTTAVMTLANNMMLDEATRKYISLDPSVQIVQVMSTEQQVEEVYEMDLHGYAGQTLVFNLSGNKEDLTILGVDKNGDIVPTLVVTGTEEEGTELPREFALHGNYPNPFNPSTQIQFDLPEHARVQIQVVDLLGREVMVLPAQEIEAGANRSVELHATSLASGTYLYRLIVSGAKNRHMKTGRMTLVK